MRDGFWTACQHCGTIAWTRYGEREPHYGFGQCPNSGWRGVGDEQLDAASEVAEFWNELESSVPVECDDDREETETDERIYKKDEVKDRADALRAMGEDDDSLMLGGCGGGERDPDLEWY